MNLSTEAGPFAAAKGKKPGGKPRQQETKEFKAEAVRLADLPGMDPTQAGQDLGVDRSLVSTWAKQMA